jgi:trk system potassium uptake protein
MTMAKRLGCPRVVALINRASYAELVEGSTIDIAISPQSVTLSALLSHIREGAPERVYSLRRGAAEAIEVVVRGDRRNSKVIGRELDDLELPESTTIGGIVRGDKLLIAHHDVMIEQGDHVILFVTNKRDLSTVIALFKEVDWH